MNTVLPEHPRRRVRVGASLAVGALLVLMLASHGQAQDDPRDLDAIWNDPFFKKQFIAGYGINAEVEPRITQEEVTILEKIRPLMADNLPKAEETLRGQIKPDSSATLDFTLGSILFQQDKMAEALDAYQRAVAKFPSFRRAWRTLGLVTIRDGNYDSAIAAFTRMMELGGGDAYAYGLLGFAYTAKQDYQPAEAAYRNALLLQPDNIEWRQGLTRCVLKQQKFEDAAALLDSLIERYPDKADFWVLQAHSFLGMKKPLDAAKNFEIVDKLGKANVDTLDTLGDIYVSENLMDLATRAYQRAVDIDPKQPPVRALRCLDVLTGRGATAQARQLAKHLHQAFDQKMEEADRTKLLKLEARLSMAEGSDSPETAAVLEEIIKINPLDGEALMLLGQHYSRQSEPDRAILYYERAESLEAFEVNAKMRHAQVLVGMARYSDAVPLLRRVQELKPRDEVAHYLEQVERLAKARR
jgi:tetratricopeptide (TPR) repeat protein